MKVAILNYSDTAGGAARAAYRLHQALLREGVESTMYVDHKSSGDWRVCTAVHDSRLLMSRVRRWLAVTLVRLQKSGNRILHSLALFPSVWPRKINSLKVDIAHLIWVNNEMLAIEDLGRITKPIVWTLQDMWAFCGSEHVSYDLRFVDGYNAGNRGAENSGIDLDRWTWNRKKRAWHKPVNIVAPSKWMAECVRKSTLMHDWPVVVIPNPLDTDMWAPVEKRLARKIMHLPESSRLLLFGTSGANEAYHKGFDLLSEALGKLKDRLKLEIIIFGQLAPKNSPDFGFPVHYIGHLHDDVAMRILYSAADVVAIPSRIDNLPNVGIEAISCATPVVAFDVCGLSDIVQHQRNGYLAKPFDSNDFANGITWVLADAQRHVALCKGAREIAVEKFSYPVIAQQYIKLYQDILGRA